MTVAAKILTTGIGSVPHPNVDSALEFAFRTDIPYLPQLSIRNPREFMIAQALEGLPGLTVAADGTPSININEWSSKARALDERLATAFELQDSKWDAFESFEPSPDSASAWQPFLFELEERGMTRAKVQLAGPLTCQWVLRTTPEVSTQIFQLIWAKAIAMTRKLKRIGVDPIFFLDEPGFFAYSPNNPRHVLALQELRLIVRALQKEGARVGIHCCSDTHWPSVLQLGMDFLSIDAGLSLSRLLQHKNELETYWAKGGRLSLGVIPTAKESDDHHTMSVQELFLNCVQTFESVMRMSPERTRMILSQSLYTPACGLAMLQTEAAEGILDRLLEFKRICSENLL